MKPLAVLLIAVATLATSCSSGTSDTTTTTTPSTTATTLPSTTIVPTTTTTPSMTGSTIDVPVTAPQFTVPSQEPLADHGHVEWRWEPDAAGYFLDATGEWQWASSAGGHFDKTGLELPVTGWYCYGSGGDRSTVVEFGGGSIRFQLGLVRTPEVVVTEAEGTANNVGNPFGEDAYLCSVAANDSHILAVGSGVFWTDDAITWNRVQTFKEYAIADVHFEYEGTGLIWAAAGPGGYIVAGLTPSIRGEPETTRAAWYSEDLDTWHGIPVKRGIEEWGYVGPGGIAVGNEPMIVIGDGAWIATRP